MDLLKAPKQFVDSVAGGFTDEHFIIAMLSGESGQAYAATPKHAKRIAQWLTYQVGEYEKKHGRIDTEWTPGMKSPIQSEDLGK
jgi:hypothetical protein